MHEPRRRGSPSSLAGAVAARPDEQSLDDWLGDISDDDWGQAPTEPAERRRATSADRGVSVAEDDVWREPAPPRPAAAGETHRAVIERRRLVAGLVLVAVLVLGVAVPVVLLRGGGQTTVTPVPAPTTTIPAPEETGPSSTPTTPSTTTPSTVGGSAFSLPAGTKLQRSEGDGEAAGDPALIRELQRALASAGFDPGPADGTFGKRTEAAVVAFQEANGLSVDGRVGPETASALNNAVADG